MLVMTRLGPPPDSPLCFAPISPVAVARGRDVMNLGRKAPFLMVHDDDTALRHRRDVRGAAASGRRIRLPFSSTQ